MLSTALCLSMWLASWNQGPLSPGALSAPPVQSDSGFSPSLALLSGVELTGNSSAAFPVASDTGWEALGAAPVQSDMGRLDRSARRMPRPRHH